MRMPSMRSSATICAAFKSSVTEPSVMRIRRSLFCVIVAAEVPIPKYGTPVQ